MSTSFWEVFFRSAGIPGSVAKSYAAIFEDNRISKEMFLDLDKEILADMGIKVMGDVIAILKHARKEARKDLVPVPGSKLPKASSVVHSTQSAQAPAVSTTSSPLAIKTQIPAHIGDSEYMEESELKEYQEVEPEVAVEHDLQPDQLLLQQVVAAVAQQQQQHQEGEQRRQQFEPILLGLEDDEFQEEYVTAAYKRQQQKRGFGTLYSDELYTEPVQKQPRLITLPQEQAGEHEDLRNTQSSLTGSSSGRRLLEAAGLMSPVGKTSVTSSGSVFSRLEHRINTSPPLHRSSTLSSSPIKRTTVKSSSGSQRLSITTSSRHRSVSDGTSGSGGLRGRNIIRKPLVSSSSNSRKESIKKRLGVRGKGERVEVSHGTTSWGTAGTTSWGDRVTTSSTSGRLSNRLGTKQDLSSFPSSTKKPRRTMVADSASNTATNITSRLGTTKSRATTSSTLTSSRSVLTKLKKERPSSSMVADEYELTRQLDIRSRLARKEDEKRERRRGLLRGRLGEHEVFTRLT